jgi:hypothetical protein
MNRLLAALSLLTLACSAGRDPAARFTASNQLLPPTDYRSWTYLTSGLGMLYGPAAAAAQATGTPAMDNVYVSPGAYEAFAQTGVWPDGALFVLEIRLTESTGSIVNGGHFQTDLLGVEVHVKDERRFADRGGWGFYGFDTDEDGPTGPAELIDASAPCYSCHREHAAVETTFTQFYPTALPVARAKGTVRADFVGIPASARELTAAFAHGGWPAAQKLLDDTAARWPRAVLLSEGALNGAAYRLLTAGRQADAIAVFEYATRRFPVSANAWESLSEAYEKAGRADDARTAVERGLQALAQDGALSEEPRRALQRALEQRRERL